MRGVILLATLFACQHYDPVDELDHVEVPNTRAAIGYILGDVGLDAPRVFAVGEYHDTPGVAPHRTALSRFAGDVIGLLQPYAKDLVVEAWLDLGCQDAAAAVPVQLQEATGRPPAAAADVDALGKALVQDNISPHGLSITCIEQSALLDKHGELDFLLLLEVVADKLRDTARTLLERDGGVIVYGGALHNDLYPEWPLDALSYAAPLSRELGGHVVEIDLVAPESVARMTQVRGERWFPLLARAAPDRAIVWRRGRDSYVVILPAQTVAVAEVAAMVR